MLIVKISVVVFVAILAVATMTSAIQTVDVSVTTTNSIPSSPSSSTASSNQANTTGTKPTTEETSSSLTTTQTINITTSSMNQSEYLAWKTQWLAYAKTAWQFFEPGVGVSPTTGLMYAFPNYHEFTDWDLASYIQAVLAAQKLGLITQNGTWGAEYRLTLILNFLQTRVLTNASIPYQFYDSDTAGIAPDVGPIPGNPADEGKLLIALYHLRIAHPELTQSIESVMSRVNYTYLALTPGLASTSEYSQYIGVGFRLWNITIPNFPVMKTFIPGSLVVPEPILMAILENVSNSYFQRLGLSLYLANYAVYNRTALLVAMGEGQYPPYDGYQSPYVYESIQVPNGTSYKIVTAKGVVFANAYPETFTKIALAFYAIYRTGYAQLIADNMTNQLSTSTGFYDGFIAGTGQIVRLLTDNTNCMIMEAANYAILTNTTYS